MGRHATQVTQRCAGGKAGVLVARGVGMLYVHAYGWPSGPPLPAQGFTPLYRATEATGLPCRAPAAMHPRTHKASSPSSKLLARAPFALLIALRTNPLRCAQGLMYTGSRPALLIASCAFRHCFTHKTPLSLLMAIQKRPPRPSEGLTHCTCALRCLERTRATCPFCPSGDLTRCMCALRCLY